MSSAASARGREKEGPGRELGRWLFPTIHVGGPANPPRTPPSVAGFKRRWPYASGRPHLIPASSSRPWRNNSRRRPGVAELISRPLSRKSHLRPRPPQAIPSVSVVSVTRAAITTRPPSGPRSISADYLADRHPHHHARSGFLAERISAGSLADQQGSAAAWGSGSGAAGLAQALRPRRSPVVSRAAGGSLPAVYFPFYPLSNRVPTGGPRAAASVPQRRRAEVIRVTPVLISSLPAWSAQASTSPSMREPAAEVDRSGESGGRIQPIPAPAPASADHPPPAPIPPAGLWASYRLTRV